MESIRYIENAEPCNDCGRVFSRPIRRGRPPTRCSECQSHRDAEKAELVTVSQERMEELYSGPARKLLGDRQDLPKGNEAQCPGCWRIFTSDSACEAHKVYGHDGFLIPCKNPAVLGMEPRERRGLPIWTRPAPDLEQTLWKGV